MLCILYVNVVGMVLGIAGVLIERALPPTFPRRWLWCAILFLSMALPGYYRYHHNWSVTEALQQASPPVAGTAAKASSIAPLNPDWWTYIEEFDSQINRVWLIVSGSLLLWGVANLGRVSLLVSRSRRTHRKEGGLEKIDGVPVVVTDAIGPATVGLLRSSVLVPRWVLAMPTSQRQYVVRHEDEHRRAHDAHLLLATSLLLLLIPWSLACWWQLRRLYLAVETDCDNRVVAALGNPHRYGELLLTVAQAANRGPRLQPALLGGAGMLERRLIELVGPPRRFAQRFVAAAVATAALLLALWMPHPVASSESHTHSMTSSTTTIANNNPSPR